MFISIKILRHNFYIHHKCIVSTHNSNRNILKNTLAYIKYIEFIEGHERFFFQPDNLLHNLEPNPHCHAISSC
jgi:hypothetical protein